MSWVCKHEGTPEEGMDPMENYGSECLVCGKPEGSSKTSTPGGGNLPPWLLPVVAGGTGLLLILGGGFLLSPSIPGVCNVLANCKSWQTDFDQAIQQGDSAVSQIEAADPAALAGLKTELQDAIDRLRDIPNSAKNASEASTKLNEYQAELDQLVAFDNAAVKGENTLSQIDGTDLDKLPDLQKALEEAIVELETLPDTAKLYKQAQTKKDEYQREVDQLTAFDQAVQPGDAALAKIDKADPEELPDLQKELEKAIDLLNAIPKTSKIYNIAITKRNEYRDALKKPPTPTPTPTPTLVPTSEPTFQPTPTPVPTPVPPPQATPVPPPQATPVPPPPDTEPYIPPVPSETQKPVPDFS